MDKMYHRGGRGALAILVLTSASCSQWPVERAFRLSSQLF
jgi:hypothetical protein